MTDGVSTADEPSPARLAITPRDLNRFVRPRADPPPSVPGAGSSGEYVMDSGPLLGLGAIPSLLVLVRHHFGSRLHVPARVAEEIQRLTASSDAIVAASAASAQLSLTSGFPLVETLTNDEANRAEGELLTRLSVLPPPLTAQPGRGEHSGECHAVALALRFGPATTVFLTNDGRAKRLAYDKGLCARSVRGLLRELALNAVAGYNADRAWQDFQAMARISAPPLADWPRGPEDFR
jgi:hypothetical protein